MNDKDLIIQVIKEYKAKGIKQIDVIDLLNETGILLEIIYKVVEELEKEGKLIVEPNKCMAILKEVEKDDA